MRLTRDQFSFFAGIFTGLASLVAFMINRLVWHFPGNNYFPPHVNGLAISLFLMYAGCLFQFGRTHVFTQKMREIIYFFSVMWIIALATTAVQYTPFTPIDASLYQFESTYFDLASCLEWINVHPHIKSFLSLIYDTLPYQMALIPLMVIAFGRTTVIREYYLLMILSTLIGFSFYYFFPTLAPASILDKAYFSSAQQATSLKFMQIHHAIPPTTREGGLISLPSFHVIWAWLCLGLVKDWPIVFFLLLPINCCLILSCVLLGWHYLMDLIGAGLVLAIAYGTIVKTSVGYTQTSALKRSP